MADALKIAGYLSVAQAADLIGCGEHFVWVLADSGELPSVKVAGGALYLNEERCRWYARFAAGSGRPLSSRMALGVLWLLNGNNPSWLNATETARAKSYLSEATPEGLVWSTRRRATTAAYAFSETDAAVARRELRPSGISLGESFGFGRMPGFEGYMVRRPSGARSSSASAGSTAQIVVHECPWLPIAPGEHMPLAVAAVDLADGPNPELREFGLDYLDGLLSRTVKSA